MGYVLLTLAIVSEVIATLSLKAAGSNLWYAVVVAIGYVTAFTLLAFALQRGLPLGVAYALWAAAGVAAVAILSVPLFGESLSGIQVAGILTVIAGVVAIELGGAH